MKIANRHRAQKPRSRAHVDLDDHLKSKLKNPEFQAAYIAEGKRIQLMIQLIKLEQQRGMKRARLVKTR